MDVDVLYLMKVGENMSRAATPTTTTSSNFRRIRMLQAGMKEDPASQIELKLTHEQTKKDPPSCGERETYPRL